MAYAPGSWHYTEFERGLADTWLGGEPDQYALVSLDDEGQRPILWADGALESVEQNEVVRLAAAAPDLLAACQLWDQGFEEGEQFTLEQFLKWMNDNQRATRAAIAKATGETQ